MLVAAAVIGSVAGGALAWRIKAGTLRQSFGWLVVAMAFFILAQELPGLLGYTSNLALAAGVAALGTLSTVGVQRLLARRRLSAGGPRAVASEPVSARRPRADAPPRSDRLSTSAP
jgi:hypothetical protein